jgi:bifunctional non-homologous end joining protein LigD
MPKDVLPHGGNDTFVISEHHARRLHWDFRLERDGVLVSWALPKGLPTDPRTNHLAKHTEDHPLEYATFTGMIPKGEYGAGTVTIWDRGTYDTEKWTDEEVKVVLHGERSTGRFALIRTSDDNWLIHRMGEAPKRLWKPMPETVRPMLATAGTLPSEASAFGYEMKWDGVRALAHVADGLVRVVTRNGVDASNSYPELQELAAAMGERAAILDGEIVALNDEGRPDFGRLQPRMHINSAAKARRLAATVPVTYLLFDLIYLDGELLTERPYAERRRMLEELGLQGSHWQTPAYFTDDPEDLLEASRVNGLEGLVAKRLDSSYVAGRRSPAWIKVKNIRTQEVVIGGWKPGQGQRSDTIGSLLLGVNSQGGLTYAGHVGTGFTESELEYLWGQLAPLARATSPFDEPLPSRDARDARWVRPDLVAEVAFGEWTRDGRLRHPRYRGLRPDKDPHSVRRES